jgi:hypothetical protein
MTVRRCRRAILGTDFMPATVVGPALYALLACSLVCPSGLAADAASSGSEGGTTIQRIERQRPSGTAEIAESDAALRNAPIKGRPLPGAHGYIWKPAGGAATHGYLIRRPDADRSASRSNLATQATRGIGATTASLAASRPVAGLKAVAGNGVIGGPLAPGRGMIGGPANGRTVIKASIDGTALRRRS